MSDYMIFSPGGEPRGIFYDLPKAPKGDAVKVPRAEIERYLKDFRSLRWNGTTFVPRPAAHPSPSLKNYERAIQHLLDRTAKSLSYDSMQSAVGYRGDPNPRYAAEAEALFAWRSAVWTAAYAGLDRVSAGATAPSPDDLIDSLPVFIRPD